MPKGGAATRMYANLTFKMKRKAAVKRMRRGSMLTRHFNVMSSTDPDKDELTSNFLSCVTLVLFRWPIVLHHTSDNHSMHLFTMRGNRNMLSCKPMSATEVNNKP